MSDLDLLRDLTDQIVPPPIEALKLTARQRSRRTTAMVSGLAAAAAITAVVAGTQLATREDSAPTPPTRNPSFHPLTYAQGPTVHYRDQSVAMAADVVELDLTDDGVVVRTSDGGIWLTDGSEPEQIGTLGSPSNAFRPELPFFYGDGAGFVVSNNRGSVAAWLEFPTPDQPELVVFDTEAREEAVRRSIDVEPGSAVVLTSVDAQYAYWDVDPLPFEDSPAGRMDLTSGEQVQSPPGPEFEVGSLPAGTPRTILVSHREGGGGPYEVDEGVHAQLGIQGGHVEMFGEQPLEALDGATRTPFSFAPPAGFKEPRDAVGWLTQWIDDDTFVFAYRGEDSATLLSCAFSTQSCEVAVPSMDAVLPEIG